MRFNYFCTLLLTFSCVIARSQTVSPSFTATDRVCVGEPVNITNTSVGATNFYWSFCSGSLEVEPEIQNLGNIGGSFSQPVFSDYVFAKNKYFAFVVNYRGGNLVRLDFGNSLLNTPVARNLGNFNNVLPPDVGAEGIQLVYNEGKWYAIIVSGYPPSGSNPKVVKIAFGPDIENNAPVATDWGNLGNMYQPIDLHLFQENGVWYGLSVNAENNTISRFNFTTSFENTPSGTNLGNIGQLEYPTGLYAINDAGTWRVFVTNAGDRTRIGGSFTLTRLDFGNSLLNDPVGTNLGNLGNMLGHPRDLTILRSCDQTVGFVINGHPGYNNMVRIDFNNDLRSIPTPTTLNVAGFSFPHSISKLFRINEDVYGFVTDAQDNTISRIRFRGCNNASIPSTTNRNPPALKYDAPGTYNINLTIDIGLPSQSSFCKQVIVESCTDEVLLTSDTTVCSENAVVLQTNPAVSYKWTPTQYLDNPNAANPISTPKQSIKYYVEATLWDNSVKRDSITISVVPSPVVSTSNDTIICKGASVALMATGGGTYNWTPSAGISATNVSNPVAVPSDDLTYRVRVTNASGCFTDDSVKIEVRNYPAFAATGDLSLCVGEATVLSATGGNKYSWMPSSLVEDPNASTTSATPSTSTVFSVTITENTCSYDTTIQLPVTIHPNPVVSATSSNDINCTTPSSQLNAAGAISYQWLPAKGLDNPAIPNPVAFVDTSTVFQVIGENEFGCSSSAFVAVNSEKSGIPSFLVPNAFTPNGDGKNDCFGIKRWGNVQIGSFNIFNRWGQLLFRSENASDCWDGTFNGTRQDAGSYVYVISANTFCGPMKRQGIITLIR